MTRAIATGVIVPSWPRRAHRAATQSVDWGKDAANTVNATQDAGYRTGNAAAG